MLTFVMVFTQCELFMSDASVSLSGSVSCPSSSSPVQGGGKIDSFARHIAGVKVAITKCFQRIEESIIDGGKFLHKKSIKVVANPLFETLIKSSVRAITSKDFAAASGASDTPNQGIIQKALTAINTIALGIRSAIPVVDNVLSAANCVVEPLAHVLTICINKIAKWILEKCCPQENQLMCKLLLTEVNKDNVEEYLENVHKFIQLKLKIQPEGKTSTSEGGAVWTELDEIVYEKIQGNLEKIISGDCFKGEVHGIIDHERKQDVIDYEEMARVMSFGMAASFLGQEDPNILLGNTEGDVGDTAREILGKIARTSIEELKTSISELKGSVEEFPKEFIGAVAGAVTGAVTEEKIEEFDSNVDETVRSLKDKESARQWGPLTKAESFQKAAKVVTDFITSKSITKRSAEVVESPEESFRGRKKSSKPSDRPAGRTERNRGAEETRRKGKGSVKKHKNPGVEMEDMSEASRKGRESHAGYRDSDSKIESPTARRGGLAEKFERVTKDLRRTISDLGNDDLF